jgi:hypothetical protein
LQFEDQIKCADSTAQPTRMLANIN